MYIYRYIYIVIIIIFIYIKIEKSAGQPNCWIVSQLCCLSGSRFTSFHVSFFFCVANTVMKLRKVMTVMDTLW